MALYMPMQPSSKIPMIAFSDSNRRAIFSPALRDETGTLASLNFRTCEESCLTFPSLSHSRSFFVKGLSVNSSLQRVLYLTPALVSDPFKFSKPTNPGQVPLQLATVNIGP